MTIDWILHCVWLILSENLKTDTVAIYLFIFLRNKSKAKRHFVMSKRALTPRPYESRVNEKKPGSDLTFGDLDLVLFQMCGRFNKHPS